MPSPVAHTAVAAALAHGGKRWVSSDVSPIRRRLFFPVVLAISFGADVDALPILWGGDLGRWHNQFTHSILFALVLAAGGAAVLRWCGVRRWGHAILLALAAAGFHLLMDWTSAGRGLMLFWPFSETRYRAPILLFEGFHWSEGWRSPRHFLTLANELAFAGAIALAIRMGRRGGKRKELPVDSMRG